MMWIIASDAQVVALMYATKIVYEDLSLLAAQVACKCSENCTNRPFQEAKKVKVVMTQRCGWGVEAVEFIDKGDFIMEYVGEVISDALCEKRFWNMKGQGITKDVNWETRLGIFAAKSIEPGEELTYDYGYEMYEHDEIECRCGASNCHGYLGTKKSEVLDRVIPPHLESSFFIEIFPDDTAVTPLYWRMNQNPEQIGYSKSAQKQSQMNDLGSVKVLKPSSGASQSIEKTCSGDGLSM
ncbi:hypothetical protein L1987_70313 [Smallanthus sonchifolius]|uniref:Uncharacterized protein n=1 Tax=Smallanthus sonchifolius TaxID=185202 RepID=A0ACB9ANP3_9ASTR|nr:hypothetical protein L1987_70313 [Smallanthus sonchifolius]